MKPVSLVRFGGRALGLSAGLFAVWTALTWAAGPPTAPVGAWVSAHAGLLASADEALMFAALCLVPGAAALGAGGLPRRPRATLVGLTALGAGVVFLLIADLALGRLVYPVFGLTPAEADLAAAAAGYYGALHAFDLAAAVAVGTLGGLFRGPGTRWWLGLTVVAVPAELASAYPWLYGPEVGAALRLPGLLWLAGAAYFLVNTSPSGPRSTTMVSSSE